MKITRHLGRLISFAVAGLFAAPVFSQSQPVTIRIGHGSAAEDQLWLMKAKPDITPGQGKAYKLEFTLFRGGDTRNQAYEAGQLDMITGSGHSAIFAASQGMKFKVIAGLSRESTKGFHTLYMVMDNSPIKTVRDLKGKTVGNNAARSSIELWQRIAFEKAGLNPDRDVNWAIVPFPSQGEAVRSGKLDLGAFPEPFASNEQRKGGMRVLFTSKDANPYDEELMNIAVNPEFAAKNAAAVRAFVADLVAATKYFLANEKAAKQALLDSKMVGLPPDVYFNMKDYALSPDARVEIDTLNKMQDDLLEYRFTRNKVDPAGFVDLSFLPR